MEILSIIPARGGSKGIHIKNLALLVGKPLLRYSIISSKQSKFVTRTIVSTDNKKISNYAKKFQIDVIERPKILSTEKAQLEPVIDNVLDVLQKKENYVPDVVVLLQNTSPLRTAKHIDESLKLFFKKKYDSVLSGFYSHYFLWKLNNNDVKPINYDPKKRPNRQEIKDQFVENGAIYVTKYSQFKKSKCRISGKIGMYVMPEELSVDINSQYDIFTATKILNIQKKNE